jgi:hypothetical protein
MTFLIENEVIRFREDEIKKNRRCHAEKDDCEDKIIKKLKKFSKAKRFYRRRLQNSSISVFSTSQMKETASEIEKSTLQIKKSEVGNSASSMRSYFYQ